MVIYIYNVVIVIKSALLAVSEDILAAQNSIVLNCDTVVEGSNTGLLFGAGMSAAGNVPLFAAGQTIWGPTGLTRAWSSVSFDKVPSSATAG